MRKTLTMALLFATAMFAAGEMVATISNPGAPRIPADPNAPLIVEVPVTPEMDQPPFGTVVQSWNLAMSGGYAGSGITWRRDSGRFYLMDQGYSGPPQMWSFDPANPTGTIRNENWTFPNLGGSATDIPWSLAWDDDSGYFWMSNILDGSVYAGCYLLKMTPTGTWTGDSWFVGTSGNGGDLQLLWLGGAEKWIDRGFFCGAPIATSPSSNNYVVMYDPYTKTNLGRVAEGDQTSERGCALVPYDSLYILTTGWNANNWRKRDTTGHLLQQVSATVYGPADWAMHVPQVINPTDTVFVYCMCNNSSNTLQKISLGMTWGQLPSVNRTSVRPTAILAPTGAVDSGQVVTPRLVIRNLSNETIAESVHVTFTIRDDMDAVIYSDQGYVLNMAQASAETLEFSAWTPVGADSLGVEAWTYWQGDSVPQDDTLRAKFMVRMRDVLITQILAPGGTADSGVYYHPSCQVRNRGTQAETFNVNFRIGAFDHDVLVSGLLPNYSRTVTATDSWLALPGNWVHQVEAVLPGDLHPENNVMVDTIYVAGTVGHDVGVAAILAPTGFYPQNATVTPSARIVNAGGAAETFWTWFSIWDPALEALVYHESLQVSLPGGANLVVNFPETDPLVTVGGWSARCSTYLVTDQNALNDVRYEDFAVTADEHNVLVRQILVPAGTVDSGLALVPTIVVENGGLSTENFPAYMQIGSYLSQANVLDLPPGGRDTIQFASWRPNAGGPQTAFAWTLLVGDERPEDDTLSQDFIVRVRDVGATEIIAPVDSQPESTWVYPEVRVRNFGATPETFDVEFRIGIWLSTATVTDLEPGNSQDVVMPDSYYTQPGVWLARAQTILTGDNNPTNDVALDTFYVAGTVTHDPAAVAVLYPAGTVQPSTPLTPEGVFANYGLEAETFEAHFRVLDPTGAEVYAESQTLMLDAGVTDTVNYPAVEFTVSGSYTAVCSTFLIIDQNWTNNVVRRGFVVGSVTNWPEGWVEVEPMPTGASGRTVKDGGWLAIDPMTQQIYAAKGYKTPEFFSYDPIENAWTVRAEIPLGVEGKPPRKGAVGVADGAGSIYATKGNNTFGFWRYDIPADSWYQMPNVPEGPSRKKVKGGTDLVYVEKNDVGYVYMLKGYKTEFYRFNTQTGAWETMENAPAGLKGKWDKGSWLAVLPEENPLPGWPMYAHQAKYYNRTTDHHYMFQYDLLSDSWNQTPLKGMPVYGLHSGRLRKKKSKDGGAGANFGNEVYALKGGNTQQFFQYFPRADSWVELDTMPTFGSTGKKKRVKYGADLVHYGSGAFFALKGNKTRELWRYVAYRDAFGGQPARGGAMTGRTGQGPVGITVAPNPIVSGRATVRYSLPHAGPASIVVYDVTGRGVLRQSSVMGRTGTMSLDVGSLSAGIYLVRVETTGWHATRKLVIE
ncbi:T9SS type A sorting domain-containing protein [candidate division WOR-3 bacterium]|nr:T9SS type A sorting domain-containing protein [candidate division WOR-3 bacterium]